MFELKQPCGCPPIYPLRDTLANFSTWKETPYGGSFPANWTPNGGAEENSIISTSNYPLSDGCPRLVWKSNAITEDTADGGYNGGFFDIDPFKKYRRTVYIKKMGTTNGTTYFGTHSIDAAEVNTGLTNAETGDIDTNPYFWRGDLPEVDKWFLLVGYVHPLGTNSGITPQGGIYEMGNPNKIVPNQRDYIFREGHVQSRVRDYLYYTNIDDVEQYYFAPTYELAEGSEMPIALMLGLDINTVIT